MNKRLNEIQKREQEATEGPWELWTGCSWRRIGSRATGKTVCEPTKCRDGQPDLIFNNGGQDGPDARFLIHSREDIPFLISALDDTLKALQGVVNLAGDPTCSSDEWEYREELKAARKVLAELSPRVESGERE